MFKTPQSVLRFQLKILFWRCYTKKKYLLNNWIWSALLNFYWIYTNLFWITWARNFYCYFFRIPFWNQKKHWCYGFPDFWQLSRRWRHFLPKKRTKLGWGGGILGRGGQFNIPPKNICHTKIHTDFPNGKMKIQIYIDG